MEISTSSNTVKIGGNIKSVSDFQTIKNSLDSVAAHHKTIIIQIPDSISVTSSVIGYFNKPVLKDRIRIEIVVGNSQLLELFQDLNLAGTFNVRKG